MILFKTVFSFRTDEPVDCAWNHTQFLSVKFCFEIKNSEL